MPEPADSSAAFTYVCSICLVQASKPILTPCGHLFCWSCIYQWTSHGNSKCPVCKNSVSKDNIIPIYTEDQSNEDQKINNKTIPPRPVCPIFREKKKSQPHIVIPSAFLFSGMDDLLCCPCFSITHLIGVGSLYNKRAMKRNQTRFLKRSLLILVGAYFGIATVFLMA